MAARECIVIVEDETALAGILRKYLENAGFEVTHISEGTDAVKHIARIDPSLVVLDLMLPGKDGVSICRELRSTSDVPIIMETAKTEEIDRLLGLEIGADDYLCKPFSPREMVARVKAVLRRSRARTRNLTQERVRVDPDRRVVSLDGRDLHLTRREFQLFQVLHRHPGRIYSRGQLLDMAYSDDVEVFDRTIDSHVQNIRMKARALQQDWEPIRSSYGVGYSYDEIPN
ncbi:transcriptional regulator [Ruegeria sp. ANG-R]|uniref:response regulator n=1 Tax=Ruegeria sp. ANG-R TaxID=1577903 RepID=UPI00057C8E28|nr:response regulator [Ruegeria sp. ANG-R]KIC41892.1 transcriptional regulator [Ruegeria sp. ANG-R]